MGTYRQTAKSYPWASSCSLPLHERAAAFPQWPEGFRGGNRGAGLVEVARILGFGRLLHLEQIGIVDLASVGAHGALAEQGIIGWKLFHLGHDGATVAIGLERLDSFEIVRDRRIDSGLDHGREFSGALGLPSLGPGAVVVVHVPIPGLGEGEALRRRQAERRDVARKHQKAGKALAAPGDAE